MAFELKKKNSMLLEDEERNPYAKLIVGAGWEVVKPKPVKEEKPEEEEKKEGDAEPEKDDQEEREEEEEEEEEEKEFDGDQGKHAEEEEEEEEEPEDITKPEVDAFCALLTKDGSLIEVVDALAKKEGGNGSIAHMGDNHDGTRQGDDEQIIIDFDKIPDQVHTLVIGITTQSGMSLSEANVHSAYARVLEPAKGGDGALRLAKGLPEEEDVKEEEEDKDKDKDDKEEEEEEEDEHEEPDSPRTKELKRVERIVELQQQAEMLRIVLDSASKPAEAVPEEADPRMQAFEAPHQISANYVLACRFSRLPTTETVKQRTRSQWYIESLDQSGEGDVKEGSGCMGDIANTIAQLVKDQAIADTPGTVDTAKLFYQFMLIKPHILQKQQLGAVLEAIEALGLMIIARTQLIVQQWQAEQLDAAADFIDHVAGSGLPSVALLLAGGANAAEGLDELCGPADPNVAKKEAPESLRALYGICPVRNVVHVLPVSDESKPTIAGFFPQYGWREEQPTGETAKRFVMEDTALGVTLNEALAELCKNRPEDPIEWLAHWLFDHNPNQPRIEEPED